MDKIVRDASPNWGGKRDGSGRKPSENPKIPWSVKVTPEERDYLKRCLAEYRERHQ